MTTTTPTSTTSPTSAAVAGSSTSGSTSNTGLAQLADNFNSFLTLLTTQLQNQDPLDPLDTNQFTQQLVEFTGVQQQVDMNTNLQTLISLQQTSEATSAMQYLGSSVTLSGSSATLASGSPAAWSINSPSPATAQVTITSSSGQVAYTGTTSLNAGTQTYSWNGQGNNGVTWPAGQYTLAINATGASGQTVAVTTQIQGTVSGVDLSQNPPELTVNGQSYPITAIQSINSGSTSVLGNLNTSIGNLNTSIGNLTQLL
ncbi:MAG TPA: flagellar hook capping FlgD N-terminal domain-containing protein [Xanthobacteraceae bacterium]|nr:flagellar hook capping FlgD N-terminal domain-containing protein [Xanthobacteraceae bacterium]